MNKIRYYNSAELRILLNNPNVETVYNNSQIKYKNEFKLWAVKTKLSHKEFTARQIFEMAGFDMGVLDDRTPQRRLLSWLKKNNLSLNKIITKIIMERIFNPSNYLEELNHNLSSISSELNNISKKVNTNLKISKQHFVNRGFLSNASISDDKCLKELLDKGNNFND